MARRKKPSDIVVIGLGRFGRSVAQSLERMGQSVLGIDVAPQKVKAVSDDITQALVLDATDEDSLLEADLPSFETAIVAMGSEFEAAALVTAHLKRLGVRQIIAQAASPLHRDILERIGATQIVIPEEDSGVRLAETLSGTAEIERLRLGGDRILLGVAVPKRLLGETVEACERSHVTVVMIRRGSEIILTPAPAQTVEQGDVLYLMGDQASLARFQRAK